MVGALESSIESRCCKLVKKWGGFAIKLNPLWNVGIPDRLILLPGGVVWFVEFKRPKGGRLGPKQEWWANKLQKLGFNYLLCNDYGLFTERIERSFQPGK